MKVFYVQNEKQLKKIILNLVRSEMIEDLDNLTKIGFLGCDYMKSDLSDDMSFDPYEQNCIMCGLGDCYLFEEHVADKDVLNHFYVEQEIKYPLILVCRPPIAGYDPMILEVITIQEAKENTNNVG